MILEREREATERRRKNGEDHALVDAHVVAPCQHDRRAPWMDSRRGVISASE